MLRVQFSSEMSTECPIGHLRETRTLPGARNCGGPTCPALALGSLGDGWLQPDGHKGSMTSRRLSDSPGCAGYRSSGAAGVVRVSGQDVTDGFGDVGSDLAHRIAYD
jgi:hypothetical protein